MSALLEKKYSILLITLFLIGCIKGENRNVNPEIKKIRNIGHAGSGFNYLFMPFNPLPTNSFQSLKNALENGADGVEVDLQLTADHELVLYHDITLESLTNLSGYVIHANSRDIVGTDYKCGFPFDLFQDETIITFSTWLDYAKQLSVIPYLQIDVKTANRDAEAAADTLIKLLDEKLTSAGYPLDKVVLISSDFNLLSKIINAYPKFHCAYQPAEFYQGLNWVKQNKCEYIIMDQKYLTAKAVSDAHIAGIGIIAMGGRSENTLLNLIAMNPDFIQANNVKMLHELLH
jgi:glycerophosphoryl diester phosphodiesterase